MDTVIQGCIVAAQILVAVITWSLYQKAKTELNARAAESPALTEVTALHKTVKELLASIEEASQESSARLEVRCAEARLLLSNLEERAAQLEIQAALDSAASRPKPESSATDRLLNAMRLREDSVAPPPAPLVLTEEPADKSQQVYHLANAGYDAPAIARETGLSAGEVELLLSLRG